MFAFSLALVVVTQSASDAWPANRCPPVGREIFSDELVETCGAIAGPSGKPYRPTEWRLAKVEGDARDALAQLLLLGIASPDFGISADWPQLPIPGVTWSSGALPDSGELTGDFDFAIANLKTDELADLRMARVPGADLLFVNGEPFLGDPERRGFEGVPVPIRAGVNRLIVAGVRGGFDLELWRPRTPTVIATWDVWWPRDRAGRVAASYGDVIAIPIFNVANTARGRVHVHYSHFAPADRGLPRLTDFQCNGSLPPLGLAMRWIPIDDLADPSFETWTTNDARFALAVYTDGDLDADRRVLSTSRVYEDARPRPRRAVTWQPLALTLGEPRADAGLPVLVPGTHTDGLTSAALLALARLWQQRFWYHADVVPAIVADADCRPDVFGPWNHPEASRILFGTPVSNRAFAGCSIRALPPPLADSALGFVAAAHEAEPSATKHTAYVVATNPIAAQVAALFDPFDRAPTPPLWRSMVAFAIENGSLREISP